MFNIETKAMLNVFDCLPGHASRGGCANHPCLKSENVHIFQKHVLI